MPNANYHKQSTARRKASTLALGIMCLSSFVLPAPTPAQAADNLSISGAGGGNFDGSTNIYYGTAAEFQSGNTSQSGSYNNSLAGWELNLAASEHSNVKANASTATSTKVLAANVNLNGGKGGTEVRVNTSNPVFGGRGGDLSVSMDSLTFDGTFTATSGAKGDFTGSGDASLVGAGGDLSLSVQRMALNGKDTQTLTFEKKDGVLSVKVQELDLSQNSARLNFTDGNTPGAGAVHFESIILGGDKTLSLTDGANSSSTQNLFSFNNLSVTGTEAKYVSKIPLDLAGKTLHFYLPASIKPNDIMLNVENTSIDLRASSIGVGISGNDADTQLRIGDKVTLIKASDGLTADPSMSNTTTGMQGISTNYTFDLESTANSLLAQVTSAYISDPAIRKSPAEGRLSSATMLMQGADLAAGTGMSNASSAAKGGANLGVAGFGAMSGDNSRYNSGSHVDVKSLALMLGFAKVWERPQLDWLAGIFFEAGWGSYKSYNSMENGNEVKGKGDSHYYGGGLLARFDLTAGLVRGLYAETSFRMGGLHSDYKSDELNIALGRAMYKTNTNYYAAHVALGYIWELTEKANLDLYGKYFWANSKGNEVHILGDLVEFKTVNSHRTRLGARFNYAINNSINSYLGMAWDYEFNGKARSVVAGIEAPVPSLKGSSGLGELGLSWKPTATSPLSVDFAVQGYIGMREGVSGNVQLRFEF